MSTVLASSVFSVVGIILPVQHSIPIVPPPVLSNQQANNPSNPNNPTNSTTTSPTTSEQSSPTADSLNKNRHSIDQACAKNPAAELKATSPPEILKDNATKRASQTENTTSRKCETEGLKARETPAHTVKPASHLGTGVGALLYSYLNPAKVSEANTVNQFNVNSPRMSNLKQNSASQGEARMASSNDERTPRKSGQFKFLDSSAFSAFSKDKLKNLQDALAKHYTNEQLNQLGI